jgi:hypothetical protein
MSHDQRHDPPRRHFPLLPGGSLFHDLDFLHLPPRSAAPPPPERAPNPANYWIDPVDLGFVPSPRWRRGAVLLADVTNEFFRARSSKVLTFEQKLWNALALTNRDPLLYPTVGVKWVTERVLKVNRDVFGRFINVTRPAAALFNNQGSLLTHGFIEIARRDVHGIEENDAEDIDESIVRLFRHAADVFRIGAREDQVLGCRYERTPPVGAGQITDDVE